MSIQNGVIAVAFGLLIAGCGASRPALDLATVNQPESVVYVRDGDELAWANAQGSQTGEVFSLDDADGDGSIWNPALSPDRTKVAFLGVGGRWPLTKQKAMLCVADLGSKELIELGQFAYAVDIGARREDAWISPPKWSSDGTRILIGDHKGVHIVPLNGDSTKTIAVEGTRESLWVPDGNWKRAAGSVMATDGTRIYYVHCTDGMVDTVLGGARTLGLFAKSDTRALAFSNGGSQLAFALDREIHTIDPTGHTRQVHKSSAPVYWMAWLPGDTTLVFLAGKKDRLIGIDRGTLVGRTLNQGNLTRGTFALSTVPITGADATRLYDQVDMDVRDAKPALSSDGRHVVLSSRHRNSRFTLFMIATDGSGQARLTKDDRCTHPIWWTRE